MKYFAFCQSDILLTKELSIPQGEAAPFTIKPWQVVTSLKTTQAQTPHPPKGVGAAGGAVVVRLDEPIQSEDYVMMPLRKSFEVLSADDYQLAGKCAELLYWDSNSKFCGCCGAPMKWQDEISKKCTNCGKQLWPQLQTAIIVRIERDDPQREGGSEILLVHALNFRGNHFGLVAGFVETGETLEECVRREVHEEVGLEVDDIRYYGSQPWPYPCGLMVGFTARYVSGNIRLQRSEIGKGGWFRHDNLPEIPGPVSIAGQMIRDWVERERRKA